MNGLDSRSSGTRRWAGLAVITLVGTGAVLHYTGDDSARKVVATGSSSEEPAAGGLPPTPDVTPSTEVAPVTTTTGVQGDEIVPARFAVAGRDGAEVVIRATSFGSGRNEEIHRHRDPARDGRPEVALTPDGRRVAWMEG